jgi:hypothetical protein
MPKAEAVALLRPLLATCTTLVAPEGTGPVVTTVLPRLRTVLARRAGATGTTAGVWLGVVDGVEGSGAGAGGT